MSVDASSKGLVLVVEDERPIADLVRLYLGRDGFGVQERRTVETSALKTGQEVGVAGVKADAANTARLIAVK